MRQSRRAFLSATLAGTASAVLSQSARAGIGLDGFKGAINAADLGVVPDAALDQTDLLQGIVDTVAKIGNPLYIPPGRYVVAGLRLPTGAHLVGAPGVSRLLLGKTGAAIRVEDAETVSLTGLTLEGLHQPISAEEGLITATDVADFVIDGCTITGASTYGVRLERCGGRIVDSAMSGCGEGAVMTNDATGLRISGNTISDCDNNGILVWRSAA
ncbi:MAG: TIGR03808 family TAT-translocated repetitive protein, partial [Rhodobiaceae bacterium]|nr:TIGR03808 family TAT-translocated repetitive protein [Rhodobiaceae bacterium]